MATETEQAKTVKTLHTIQSEVQSSNRIALSVDCVIFGFDEDKLKVMLIRSDLKKYLGKWSLLGDLVRPDEDLDAAAYRILKQRTGLNDVYLEQVHTFGSVGRHPAGRVVTVTYCSLIFLTESQCLFWLYATQTILFVGEFMSIVFLSGIGVG